MPSKERHELIETVAQKMQAKWSGGLINWDRLHGQLKKDYRDIAEVAVDAILAALKEPTEGMIDAALYSWQLRVQKRLRSGTLLSGADGRQSMAENWRAMLNASALGEQSE
ncbi:hypothetical protein [Brucella intermedia]|uniref:hypothetical protein n=1 Tax=Brucella intermedia TaxID=94625 RepID=UPI0021C7EEF4|nr:hypothetical protein [Brucella intermedia]UXO85620.1 hypothetical protein N8I72_14750 [Brucella intermedia]